MQRYLPEFDEEEVRQRLSSFSKAQLLDMLIIAYKEKRVLAKDLGETLKRLEQIADIAQAPSALLNMPDVPSGEDLRRMAEDEGPDTGSRN